MSKRDELREAVTRLRRLVGAGTGHSAHWDRTGGHGAGCTECHAAREARQEAAILHDRILALTDAAAGEKAAELEDAASNLAMLVLQSDTYAKDVDAKEAVDDILALTILRTPDSEDEHV